MTFEKRVQICVLLLLLLSVTSARGIELTGRLVGADGRGIASAELHLTPPSPSPSAEDGEAPHARSTEQGEFRISVPRAGPWRLLIDHPAYQPKVYDLPDLAADHRLPELHLRPTLTLDGRAVTVGGKALAEVFVEARPQLGWGAQLGGPTDNPGTLHAHSDAHGRFRLQELEPKTPYRLVASRSGYVRQSLMIAPVELGKPPEAVTIKLAPGTMGFGTVLDLDERPLVGAHVRLQPALQGHPPGQQPRGDDPATGTTDAAGRFELRDLAPGIYSLAVSAPGYSELSVPGIEVTAAESFDLGTLLLEPGHHLAGRVIDPEGKAIAGAKVSWRAKDPARITGSDGTFVLEGLPARAAFDLEVEREGFQQRRLRGVRSSDEPFDVVLEPGVTLRGAVVDAGGKPAVGVRVELVREAGPVTTISTDAAGGFELQGLAPGEVTVSARSGSGYSQDRRLALDATESPLWIHLELRAGATVSGRVLDPAEAGVPGSVIELEPYQPGILEPRLGATNDEGRADSEGRYSLAGLAEGRYRLTVRHPDFVPVSATLEVTREEHYSMDWQLTRRRPRSRLAGRIVDADRKGVSGAAVTLFPVSGGEPAQTVSRGDGRFELGAEVPGEHYVEVRHPHFAAYRSGVFDLAGEPADEILVELTTGGLIIGAIHGLDLEQLARLKILAFSHGLSVEGQVAYDGSYRLAGLAAGEWRVQALAGTRTASGTATLSAAGETASLDLRFAPGFQLSGSARIDGDPLSGARIAAACDVSGYRATTSSDGEGRFELSDVPQGPCTLTLTDNARSAYAERQVEVWGETEVEIEVKGAAFSGQVLTFDGLAPIVGATVELLSENADDPRLQATAVTGPDGRFTLAATDRGTGTLRVSKEGFALSERRIEPDAGQDLRLLLQPAEDVVLYVRTLQGDVPSQVGIEIRSTAGAAPALALTYQPDLDGKITLRSLPPGFWQVHVSGQGAVAQAKLKVPGEPALIVLGAGG